MVEAAAPAPHGSDRPRRAFDGVVEVRRRDGPITIPRRAWPLVLALLLGCLALLLLLHASARAAGGCRSAPNPVVCENALPGDPPSDWQVGQSGSAGAGATVGDPTIQGFATTMSVNPGDTVSFKISATVPYHIDILRLGYYGGNGARKVASSLSGTVQSQPACTTDSTTGLIDCGNWSVSAQWAVPSDAVSGVYMAHLVRNDGAGSSQVMFVVRDDSSHSQVLVQTSDATWQAYNDYGGNSLYTCTVACPPGNPLAYKAAYAVSYNRPIDGSLNVDGGQSDFFYAEYQLVRWLERNGYDTSYIDEGTVDSPAGAGLIKQHRVFVSSAHDEYWSAGQRASVESALAGGVNLAFLSGNEIFWKTRWDATHRTLITYKETHFNSCVDPADPPTWTGAWADPRCSPPADGGRPANALTGQQFEVNAGSGQMTVPGQYAKLRMWRHTGVASLAPGATITLAPGANTIGYEWDEDEDNGFRPAGLFDLSSTTLSGLQVFTDYGSTTADNQTATHHLTLYQAPNGALVFGAGTVQWSWGLDNTNAWGNGLTDPGAPPPDPNVEQATVNLLADMGVQPATLVSGLQPATASTDTTPPTSTVTSIMPYSGSVTVSGTSTDSGGGVVAGVEVSTDGGSTWHPATITTPDDTTVSWTFSGPGTSAATIRVRASDDSGNLEGRVRPGAPSPPGGSSPTTPPGRVSGAQTGTVTVVAACVRNRKLALRVNAPKHQRLRRVTIAIGHRVLRTLRFSTKGKHRGVASTTVHLKNLPKGTFTLTITIHTVSGKTITTHRRYHPCVSNR
jgi:hypothetical protein